MLEREECRLPNEEPGGLPAGDLVATLGALVRPVVRGCGIGRCCWNNPERDTAGGGVGGEGAANQAGCSGDRWVTGWHVGS